MKTAEQYAVDYYREPASQSHLARLFDAAIAEARAEAESKCSEECAKRLDKEGRFKHAAMIRALGLGRFDLRNLLPIPRQPAKTESDHLVDANKMVATVVAPATVAEGAPVEATAAVDGKAEEAAMRAVDAIVYDLSDRRGLKSEWHAIDERTQAQIKRAWRDCVLLLGPSSPPPPSSSETALAEMKAERDEQSRQAALYHADMMNVRRQRDAAEADARVLREALDKVGDLASRMKLTAGSRDIRGIVRAALEASPQSSTTSEADKALAAWKAHGQAGVDYLASLISCTLQNDPEVTYERDALAVLRSLAGGAT